MNTIRVLLTDDHAIVRESLMAVLRLEADISICATASDGRQAARLAATHRPDIVLMDVSMPGQNGIDATREILENNARARVIMLSAHGEACYVFGAINAGASGYLLKHTSADILATAIREVHRGHAYFSPSIAGHVARFCRDITTHPGRKRLEGPLTRREREVVQLVAEGRVNKEIGTELKISRKTVEKHRQTLMHKLAIHNVAGLTRYAVLHGIIEVHGGFDGINIEAGATSRMRSPT
jgi:DNA-binding NarL/FixJ family response regulator